MGNAHGINVFNAHLYLHTYSSIQDSHKNSDFKELNQNLRLGLSRADTIKARHVDSFHFI